MIQLLKVSSVPQFIVSPLRVSVLHILKIVLLIRIDPRSAAFWMQCVTVLPVCMYEIRDCQDPVKGSGWVLFPSTMAEQPIQQMVLVHLCFQECAVHNSDCYFSLFIICMGRP